MGNTLSNQSTQTINVETYIKDFKMFEFIENIKTNRFLKTFLVKYSKNCSGTPQKVLVKLYGSSNSDNNKIKSSVHDIRQLKKLFDEIPSIITYKDIIVTERSCMAYRPWIHYNLYDRLSTRPFLAEDEKIWIVYQILRSLNHIHEYLAHGDLKLENILLTSWGFVIISDLSFQIKPTYLSDETVTNEFNYFFDTSGRQSCYIAPERLKRVTSSSIFYTNHHEDEPEQFKLYGTEYTFLANFDLVPSMDIFFTWMYDFSNFH
uniref:Phosphoinositide 3-kinase regulatory subunit 4 (Trinotate prediction) n=1 Tax=Myxobolus squamalis TaxID=59785 RepID=A0A6B2FX83_MYXSQ